MNPTAGSRSPFRPSWFAFPLARRPAPARARARPIAVIAVGLAAALATGAAAQEVTEPPVNDGTAPPLEACVPGALPEELQAHWPPGPEGGSPPEQLVEQCRTVFADALAELETAGRLHAQGLDLVEQGFQLQAEGAMPGADEDAFRAAAEAQREAAQRGYAPAYYAYALHLIEGLGAPRDEPAALPWLRAGAEAGDPRAMVELAAYLRLRAEGTQARAGDELSAATWYRRAIALNYMPALADYAGYLLELGETEEALSLLERAVEDEAPNAGGLLADLLLSGAAGRFDWPRAAELYRVEAEAGSEAAMRALARVLLLGLGVEPDPEAAHRWLEAAEADDLEAQSARARLLAQGLGVARDEDQAARRFTELLNIYANVLDWEPEDFDAANAYAWNAYGAAQLDPDLIAGHEALTAITAANQAVVDPTYLNTEAHLRAVLGEGDAANALYVRAMEAGGSYYVRLYQNGLRRRGLFDGAVDGLRTPALDAALRSCARDPDCSPLGVF